MTRAPAPAIPVCPKCGTPADACFRCDDAALDAAQRKAARFLDRKEIRRAYMRGYLARRRHPFPRPVPVEAQEAIAAERERVARETMLAKGASHWMGREAFDALVRRIRDPKCDPYGKRTRRAP
jgi:hypothetical protein